MFHHFRVLLDTRNQCDWMNHFSLNRPKLPFDMTMQVTKPGWHVWQARVLRLHYPGPSSFISYKNSSTICLELFKKTNSDARHLLAVLFTIRLSFIRSIDLALAAVITFLDILILPLAGSRPKYFTEIT